jgi:hypothetical protein
MNEYINHDSSIGDLISERDNILIHSNISSNIDGIIDRSYTDNINKLNNSIDNNNRSINSDIASLISEKE